MAKKKKIVPKAPVRLSSNGRGQHAQHSAAPNPAQRTYTIVDNRLEKPNFSVHQVRKGDDVRYEVEGDLSAPAPPIRESKYLDKQQAIEIYRYMLLNRR